MELSIAVCDDLQEARVGLIRMIRQHCRERDIKVRIKMYASGDELVSEFLPGRFHILFLDIYMPGMNGMEAARRIRQTDDTCSIIFSTTSQDHGVESFGVRAADYLVKPFRKQEVGDALDWCVEQMANTYRSLLVSSEWEQVEVPLRALRYIEIRGHRAHLHLDGQTVVTRRSMDDLEQEINHPDFLRCHRSYLVNMNFIQRVEKNSFLLRGGAEVPIGSTGVARAKEHFMNWFFLKTWACK